MKNYYKILGVTQNCSKEDIKKAFRELAFQYHPDKNSNEGVAEQFKEINEARQVLVNDFDRLQYDNLLLRSLGKNKTAPTFPEAKRKKPRKRSVHLELLKETVLDKVFLTILLIVTVPLIIAFYQIPEEEYISTTPSIAKRIALENTLLKVDTSTKPPLVIQKVAETPKSAAIVKAAFVEKKAFRKNAGHRAKSHISTKHYKRHQEPNEGTTARVGAASRSKKIGTGKQLSYKTMLGVLNQIKIENKRTGNNTKRVQILKARTSNISNAFKLADFLKSYGYVISGREKISTDINGININSINNCIFVTIGTL